jgi:2-amino-4-hydroxy-6-hydroxymethyldihydropteridine diphosphokinase
MNGETVAEDATLALVVFGSNIDPERNLPRALTRLRQRTDVVAVSNVYRTQPVGRADAPPFLNAAVALRTQRPPAALKRDVLRPIERQLGRVRTTDRNAPRTIDLDLVLYGDRVVDDPQTGLRLPDPDIETRAHVALPLAEVAPDFEHPVRGETLAEIAQAVTRPGVIRRVEVAGWEVSLPVEGSSRRPTS